MNRTNLTIKTFIIHNRIKMRLFHQNSLINRMKTTKWLRRTLKRMVLTAMMMTNLMVFSCKNSSRKSQLLSSSLRKSQLITLTWRKRWHSQSEEAMMVPPMFIQSTVVKTSNLPSQILITSIMKLMISISILFSRIQTNMLEKLPKIIKWRSTLTSD